jgi:vesicle-fusing ATPase
MLTDMEISDTFLADIRVPSVTSLRSVDHVLRQTGLFQSEEEHDRCMQLLTSAGLGEDGRLNIGIKKVCTWSHREGLHFPLADNSPLPLQLLSEIEMARLDDDPADKLTAALNVY